MSKVTEELRKYIDANLNGTPQLFVPKYTKYDETRMLDVLNQRIIPITEFDNYLMKEEPLARSDIKLAKNNHIHFSFAMWLKRLDTQQPSRPATARVSRQATRRASTMRPSSK